MNGKRFAELLEEAGIVPNSAVEATRLYQLMQSVSKETVEEVLKMVDLIDEKALNNNKPIAGEADIERHFVLSWLEVAKKVNNISVEKGWWKGNRNDGELIALMHSELSEAL